MRHWDQIPRESIETVKGEFVNALKITHSLRGSVNGKGPKFVRKAAQVVESHDVIGMGMGEDHCIQTPDVFAQRLGAKIGSGIYHPGALWSFDINRGAQALIPRIRGMANLAITTNHRHTL